MFVVGHCDKKMQFRHSIENEQKIFVNKKWCKTLAIYEKKNLKNNAKFLLNKLIFSLKNPRDNFLIETLLRIIYKSEIYLFWKREF